MSVKEHPVAKRSKEVEDMKPDLDLVSALMGGTRMMRSCGEKYMPRFPAEDPMAHATRISVATLRPAYKKTVRTLVGKPMAKPIKIEPEPKERWEEILDNIDMQGHNIDSFVADVMEKAIAHGQCHFFVEAPKAAPGLTVAQEREQGIRPYFVKVEKSALLGWTVSGNALMSVRFKELVKEKKSEFEEAEVEQIRVLMPGAWQVWRIGADPKKPDEWALFDKGESSLKEITWVTVFARRTGYMSSEPPLIELAHLNVKHWQSQSDQDNITHIVRVPILAVSGVDTKFSMTIGSQAAIRLPSGGDMRYIEHTGNAVGAGKTALDDLVEEMRQAGAEMLVPRGVAATATEVASDNVAQMSDLQRIVRDAQDSFNLGLEFVAKMIGEGEESAPEVSIFNEFDASFMATENSNLILQSQTAGLISKKTALRELQRRGTLSDSIDYDDEQQFISEEGPPEGKTDPLTGLPYDKPAPPQAGE